MTRRTWEEQVRYAMHHKDTIQAMREKKEKTEHKKRLRRLIPIPLIVGVIAAMTMYHLFGWEKLVESFLSWIIGLTLIAALITYLPKNLAK
jgi:polyferredoxin